MIINLLNVYDRLHHGTRTRLIIICRTASATLPAVLYGITAMLSLKRANLFMCDMFIGGIC